jgi:hypothetical protein
MATMRLLRCVRPLRLAGARALSTSRTAQAQVKLLVGCASGPPPHISHHACVRRPTTASRVQSVARADSPPPHHHHHHTHTPPARARFVGYTNDHEALAYYTNTATEGAYVAAIDTADGSLCLLDVRLARPQQSEHRSDCAPRLYSSVLVLMASVLRGRARLQRALTRLTPRTMAPVAARTSPTRISRMAASRRSAFPPTASCPSSIRSRWPAITHAT